MCGALQKERPHLEKKKDFLLAESSWATEVLVALTAKRGAKRRWDLTGKYLVSEDLLNPSWH